MVKKLCKDCIRAHLEREDTIAGVPESRQERVELHERMFEGWFDNLWCYTTAGAAPCFRISMPSNSKKYLPFKYNYNYDWITNPPNSCPCILEHLICDNT